MEETLIVSIRIMVMVCPIDAQHQLTLPFHHTAAGMLIIWDRIFGTFAPESDKVVYGLVHPLDAWNPLWGQLHHAYYIVSSIGSQKGLVNKVSFLVKGPGWSPGKPRLGNREDLPEVSFLFMLS